MAADPTVRDQLVVSWSADHEVMVATSPLDVIRRIESEGTTISTIVLSDIHGSVARADLAEFLSEAYPNIRVLLTSTRSEADRSRVVGLAELR